MAKEKGITVIMSLHEIDLAQKIADQILCVKGDHVCYYGTPEQIFEEQTIRELYGIENGFYDPRFGSIELQRLMESRRSSYRRMRKGNPNLQEAAKGQYPFCNRYPVYQRRGLSAGSPAGHRGDPEEPFTGSPGEHLQKSTAGYGKKMQKKVICADVPIGECNKGLEELIRAAKKKS